MRYLYLLFGTLAVIAILTVGIMAEEEKAQKCPSFTLQDMNDKTVTLESLLGKGPILIDFWTTWCKPCRKEMKALQPMYEKYADKGFKVVAISLDEAKATEDVKKQIMQQKYSFTVLLDPSQETAKKLGYPGIMPFSLMIDSKGNIRHKHVGFNPGDEAVMEKELLALIKEQSPEGKRE